MNKTCNFEAETEYPYPVKCVQKITCVKEGCNRTLCINVYKHNIYYCDNHWPDIFENKIVSESLQFTGDNLCLIEVMVHMEGEYGEKEIVDHEYRFKFQDEESQELHEDHLRNILSKSFFFFFFSSGKYSRLNYESCNHQGYSMTGWHCEKMDYEKHDEYIEECWLIAVSLSLQENSTDEDDEEEF